MNNKQINSVLDPDGKFRTVRYTADKKTGFHADIITDGHTVHHPQDPVKPVHQDPVYPYVPYVPQAHGGNDDGGTAEGGGGEEDEYGEGYVRLRRDTFESKCHVKKTQFIQLFFWLQR